MILVILALLALAIPITFAFIKAGVDLWIIITFLIALVLFFVISIWMYHNKENIEKKHKDEQPLESYGEIPRRKTEVVLPRNKLAIVVQEIVKAKQITPKGDDVIVYLDKFINAVNIEELHNILLRLQNDERIITITYFPDFLLPTATHSQKVISNQIHVILDPIKRQFRVETRKKFNGFAQHLAVS